MKTKPKSFASRAQFRAWLQRNHARVTELNLRLYKVHARERGVTYREALDEALCFGWIAGVRRALDDELPPGLAAWRTASRQPAGYSFESKPTALAKAYLAQFAANAKAHAYFRQEAPWYRRVTSFYVMSAKQEATRQRRLKNLIACCAQQRRIGMLEKKAK